MAISNQDAYRLVFKEYPDVVTVAQMSAMLGISVKTAYSLLKENKIKSMRFGNKYVIPKLHIMSYLSIINNSK